MVAFDDRIPLQMIRCTDAVRAAHTWAAGELVVVVDGGGVPTGAIYLGDGTTVGGLGPFLSQGALDHGSLAGLGDSADHSWATMVNGMHTGVATFLSTLSLAGLFSSTGQMQQVRANPQLIQWNTVHSNADGGRANATMWAGEKADGTQHTLAMLIISHSGTGDDQRCKVELYLNDGDDGFVPTKRALLVDYDGSLTHDCGRLAEYVSDVDQSRLGSLGPTDVKIGTTLFEDTGFVRSGNEVTCNFDGRVRLAHRGKGQLDNGAHAYALFNIHRKPSGGSFAALANTDAWMECDSETAVGSVALPSRVFDVTSGDVFKVVWDVSPSGGVIEILAGDFTFSLSREQPAS